MLKCSVQKLCKSRTSNYWNHSSEIDTLVNQDNHAAPIRSPARGRTGFAKSRGFRASVTFFPLPHPLPFTVLLSPHFSRNPNTKTPSRGPNFGRSVRERLLRRLQKLRKNALCLDQSHLSNFAPYIIKAWKKSGLRWIRTHVAIPLRCSTNWAIKPSGSWSFFELVIYPWTMQVNIWNTVYLNCG